MSWFLSLYVASLLGYACFYSLVSVQWFQWSKGNVSFGLDLFSCMGPDFSGGYLTNREKLSTRSLAVVTFWGLVPVANSAIVFVDVFANIGKLISFLAKTGYLMSITVITSGYDWAILQYKQRCVASPEQANKLKLTKP